MNDILWGSTGVGTTPLDPDEAAELIPGWITTRGALDDYESGEIAEVRDLVLERQVSFDEVVDDLYLRDLHKRMFGNVWRWAGSYRRSGKNIGIDADDIAPAMLSAVRDGLAWRDSGMNSDELCARFHHRIEFIHPFPNGNGRWGRLATDLVALSLDRQLPTWGVSLDATAKDVYLAALRAADDGAFDQLIAFMRS